MKKRLIIPLCIVLILPALAGLAVHEVRGSILEDLSALNLPGVQVYREMSMTAGKGFLAQVMPWYERRDAPGDLRAEALEAISDADGWHVTPIPAASYEALMLGFGIRLPLHPPQGTVFEAWFFRQEDAFPDALPDAPPAGPWTLAFFDRDTGVFISLTDAVLPPDAAFPAESCGLEDLHWEGLLVLRQETPFPLAALEVPAFLRGAVLQRLLTAPGWQRIRITGESFSDRLNRMQEEVHPHLYPAEGVVFEWCFHRDSLYALFDPDTGLFLCYESDS